MNDPVVKQPVTYFTAAPWKLVLMSLLTSGIYDFYWFYKNWQLYRKRTGKIIMPGWRAVFSPLWAYGMFSNICDMAGTSGVRTTFNPGTLALAYAGIFVTDFLPAPLDYISYGTFIPLIIANELAAAVSRANDPAYVENNRLSIGNLIAIVLGLGYIAANIALARMYPQSIPMSIEDMLKMSQPFNQ